MRDPEEVLGPRLTPPRRCFYIGHGLFALTGLEQQEPVLVGSADMPSRRCLRIQGLRPTEIGLDTPAKTIGLREIKLRVRITLCGRSGPFVYRGDEISGGPCVDTGLYIGLRRNGDDGAKQGDCRCAFP